MRTANIYFISLFAIVSACVLSGCKRSSDKLGASIDAAIEVVCSKYAPDNRTAICEILVRPDRKVWVLSGKTNIPEAKEELLKVLEAQRIPVMDSISLLPLQPDSSYAMVRVSVANLRARPSHTAELVTQATLGLPLRVYWQSRGWYRVQTPDTYIAWVNGGAIILLTKRESDSIARLPKIIFLDTYGFSYESPESGTERVSDLVAGTLVTYIGEKDRFYHIGYPDGRTAWIPVSTGRHYSTWLRQLTQEGSELTKTAITLKGIPYLWGGTSTKEMDCSGFTKTVYFLNGMILPRDASQQSQTGILIDSTQNFDNFQPGDLLFFGKKASGESAEKVIHVGLWLGDGRFIHASGDVHISSLLHEADDFDEYNEKRYLKTRRILNTDDRRIINLKMNDVFKIGE